MPSPPFGHTQAKLRRGSVVQLFTHEVNLSQPSDAMGSLSRHWRREEADQGRIERIHMAWNALHAGIDRAAYAYATTKDPAKKKSIKRQCLQRCSILLNTLEQLDADHSETFASLIRNFIYDTSTPPPPRIIVPGINRKAYRELGVHSCIVATLQEAEGSRRKTNADIEKLLDRNIPYYVQDRQIGRNLWAFVRRCQDRLAGLRFIKNEYSHYNALHRQYEVAIDTLRILKRHRPDRIVTKDAFLRAIGKIFH